MIVPSGRILDDSDIHLLRQMAHYGFIRWRYTPFILKSGVKSHVYVFGRQDITDNPDFEAAVGRKIWRFVSGHADIFDCRQLCLIGIPTAGTVLAQAASAASYHGRSSYFRTGNRPICHRLMREIKKAHGAHRTWVNGEPDFKRHSYWLVDNVATDGQSKIEAAKKLQEDGYPAKEMPCLIFVDRQQGAVRRLEREGFKRVVVAFNLLDIAYAFGKLNLWPKDAAREVEEEIRAHQLIG